MTCPGELALARAIAEGSDPELAAHLAGCAACRATWDATTAAIELARELPVALPPAARREELRTAVLAAGAHVARRPARRAWLVPLIAGAAAAAVAVYLAIPAPVPAPYGAAPDPAHRAHGTVHPHPGARYLASAAAPDELVRLWDGAIDVEVEPLGPGERFRVVVGGAEIEVRGTAFTVSASADHLTTVTVARGRVEVRPDAGAAATLTAGQSWRLTTAAAASPPNPGAPPTVTSSATAASAPAINPSPPPGSHTVASHAAATSPAALDSATPPPGTHAPIPPHIAPGAPASSAEAHPATPPSASGKPAGAGPRSPEEQSYDQAWEALRASNFLKAASGFTRVVLLAPDSPLVEDASFWRAVALARGKQPAEARSAFVDFLGGFPRSARAGEASAMLGWILIDARELDEARRRFRAALGDPSPAVRRSAAAGLDALAQRTP
ncbi:MAG TPA: FecR domain-containing protein [Kofleriaceae bacterium]|nr:FecR domain-containing protein [Kofleriaceae bacterium]